MSRLATEKDNLAFGQRLARLRLGHKLSQAEFATALGLSLRAYVNYERGEREAPLSVARAVHAVYGIDPLWLMCGPGETPMPVAVRDLDLALLESVTARIDEQLAAAGKTLPEARRRHLIEAGYAECRQRGALEIESLDRLVSVASAA